MRLTYLIIEFVVYEIWEESEELSLLEHIMYFSLYDFLNIQQENARGENMLNSSHKCNRPSHLRNYDPKFNKSIFLGSQIA